MASTSITIIIITHHHYLFIIFLLLLFLTTSVTSSSVLEDLNNLKPPSDFNTTITTNCLINPSLRYCNNNDRTTPFDLHEIFKYTIVARHLCNISNNTDCVESFRKIDLHGQCKVAPLYLSFSFFWKYCPLTLISIDLSDNSLMGKFPNEIFKCSQVRAVDLSHNKLSGDLHAEDFSLLQNLTYLNLSYNDFSEVKDSKTRLFLERFDSSGFVSSGLFPNPKEFRLKTLLLLVGLPFLVIVTVVFLASLCFQKPEMSDHGFSQPCLEEAAGHFSSTNLMEKQKRFSIYKGVMSGEREVRIETYFHEMSGEERTRFVERCNVLVHLHHENIVSVLGWCDGDSVRAVVSKWSCGDSMEKWLRTSNPSWKQRVDLILRVSDAISYVNEEWPRVVCNLKTKNILVSADGEPIITRLKLDDHRSNKKNIFRFGMFVLEMITDMRPMETSDMKETGFIEWIKLHYPEKLEDLIDEKMKMTREIVYQAEEMIKLGLICTDVYTCHPELSWAQVFRLLQDKLCKVT